MVFRDEREGDRWTHEPPSWLAPPSETTRATARSTPSTSWPTLPRPRLLRPRLEPTAVRAVRVLGGVWPYQDPGALIATRVGCQGAATALTIIGGNEVYDLVGSTAAELQAGHLDCALITGAEALRTRRRDHRAGAQTQYLKERDKAQPTDGPPKARDHYTEVELRAGLATSAVAFYSLVESAIRHREQENVAEHRARIASLWEGASKVAQRNPRAWMREPVSAAEISEPSPSNRMVSDPYPKLMTSNVNVDQGASVVMMTASAAEAAGVPKEQWVFLHSGVGADDAHYASQRWAMDESPAMRLAGRAALDLAGVSLDDCNYIDLYSCFPAAVQVAQRELGVDKGRDFTITGGLTFAGGPLNSYCLLPLVRATELLRETPGGYGFLYGNGGFFHSHSFLVLGQQPPTAGYQTTSVQASVDALPQRQALDEPAPSGLLEAYTVEYDRTGAATHAVMAQLTGDGHRAWVRSGDADLCAALISEDMCGANVTATGDLR